MSEPGGWRHLPARAARSGSKSAAAVEPGFEPLEHSVYYGRQRLGRYDRIAKKLYAAFDALDRPLGKFKTRAQAYAAVSAARHVRRLS